MTASAISALFPRGKVSVSIPCLNSALGTAGAPARTARTLARTIAWRKIGTGPVLADPRSLTRRVLPPSAHDVSPLIAAGRFEGFAFGAGLGADGRDRGSGAILTPGCPRNGFGAAGAGGAGNFGAATAGAGALLTTAQPEASMQMAPVAATRALPAMVWNLSCDA